MDKRNLIEEILRLHQHIGRVMMQYHPAAWLELNLTIAQLKSLFFISHEGSTNFSKLATALAVTPANVTGIVNRLVKQRLVHREENPENRRMHILSLTDEGKALVAKLWESRTSQEAMFLAQLSPDDLSTLARGLAALAQAVESGKRNIKNEGQSFQPERN